MHGHADVINVCACISGGGTGRLWDHLKGKHTVIWRQAKSEAQAENNGRSLCFFWHAVLLCEALLSIGLCIHCTSVGRHTTYVADDGEVVQKHAFDSDVNWE